MVEADSNKDSLDAGRAAWEIVFVSHYRNDKGRNHGSQIEKVNLRYY